jgi:uncharacterized protein with von Willebrand factor type A (vWA) domain
MIAFCRSLRVVGMVNREDVYHAARATLLSHYREVEIFDTIFDLFWRYPRDLALVADAPDELSHAIREVEDEGKGVWEVKEWNEGEALETEDESEKIGYSPEDVLTKKDFGTFSEREIEVARQIIVRLAEVIATQVSRRREPSGKGREVDFRRTWRKTLVYGNDATEIAFKRRKIKKPKLLLLCDVSGSMDRYSRFLVQFICGLQRAVSDVEVAVFSTRLTVISSLLRTNGVQKSLDAIARTVPDWSGGTDIGRCLGTFNTRFGRTLVTSKSVVIVVSDGWDRGDAERLRREMERLQQRCHRLVWLNPLLGSPGYQPLTRGMQAALPYVDDFLPAHNLESLANLGRKLRGMWG